MNRIDSRLRIRLHPGTRMTYGMRFLISVLLVFVAGGFAFGQDSSADQQDNKLSPKFTQAAISAMVSIHQAKQNIATVVTRNLPSGYYNPSYAAQAYEQVNVAQVDATTNGDQQAATLLSDYFNNVKSWAENYKAQRESMNATTTMGQDFLKQDPKWQNIESCEKAMNSMLTSREYTEIFACE
jgi:hypothetical protein